MSPTDLASSASKCLTAWTSGDLEATRSFLSEDVTFDGPMGHTQGAQAYVEGVAQMAKSVKGIDLKKTFVDGDDVCIMYDLLSEAQGSLPTVNWYHFRDYKIDSVRAYFDPRLIANGGSPAKKPLEMPLFAAALQLCGSVEPEELVW